MPSQSLGLLRSTMLHDEPLDFIWLGVLLERVSQTARTTCFEAFPRSIRYYPRAPRRSLSRAAARARYVGCRT
ncbi:MAG: alpha-E domain-containing protein [Myxococcota bacterium]|nr:alpha-E domain-containing protein [Myxococcota bacterium]